MFLWFVVAFIFYARGVCCTVEQKNVVVETKKNSS